ncbi:hypothetical protein AKJ09_06963 [Labilithrix luteola]|uniref:Uncharacterized protein n=1 Tax=Labilithrix luteola TaxID=1391654 RepID=A0A0K1Q4I6_9BACT|nr:hypothetical protein [Labilithrix luteola]AKV00300.1 hypothetical protein AKJ09_06963 [Labilithrix luteola]
MLDDDQKLLETLIQAGRMGPGPDAQQVERMERRLEPAFLSAQSFASSTPRVHAAKWILAVIGIGIMSAASDTREMVTGRGEPQSVAARAEVEPVATAIAAPAEPPPSIVEPAPVPAKEPIGPSKDSHVAVAKSISARTPTKLPLVNPPAPAAPEPVAAVDPPVPSKVDEPAASPAPEASPSAPIARAPSGESEVAYLRRAQASLNMNPTRALALADEHPSRFPEGVLAQEREVIAIDALVKLRRTAEARTRAGAFRSRYPSSAHLARVLSAVGDMP